MAAGDGGDTTSTVSGGIQQGPVLQGRDFTGTTFVTSQAAAAPAALAQLPPLVTGFTGREVDLARVAGLLDPSAAAGAVVVSAVAGLAGVGKTALATHAAHAARLAGWFPGGMLFIDLHGYDPSPVQPAQALDALLRALGIAGEHIPEGTDLRAALYRSALDQVRDPVLVIIDNASAEAQVRPLLPGPGPHRVIITSRHTLAGLGRGCLTSPSWTRWPRCSCWTGSCGRPGPWTTGSAQTRPPPPGWPGCAAGCRWHCRSPRLC